MADQHEWRRWLLLAAAVLLPIAAGVLWDLCEPLRIRAGDRPLAYEDLTVSRLEPVDIPGVTLTVEDIDTREGFIRVCLTNSGSKTYHYDPYVFMEAEVDGTWRTIPYVWGDTSRVSLLLLGTLRPDENDPLSLAWWHLYGTLREGHYRVCAYLWGYDEPMDSGCIIAAEMDLVLRSASAG